MQDLRGVMGLLQNKDKVCLKVTDKDPATWT